MKNLPAAVSHETEDLRELKDSEVAVRDLDACVQVAFPDKDPVLIRLALYNIAQAQKYGLLNFDLAPIAQWIELLRPKLHLWAVWTGSKKVAPTERHTQSGLNGVGVGLEKGGRKGGRPFP